MWRLFCVHKNRGGRRHASAAGPDITPVSARIPARSARLTELQRIHETRAWWFGEMEAGTRCRGSCRRVTATPNPDHLNRWRHLFYSGVCHPGVFRRNHASLPHSSGNRKAHSLTFGG